ncbi:MAG: (Fe-S)-binding protein [Gemmatimonadota bacterium]
MSVSPPRTGPVPTHLAERLARQSDRLMPCVHCGFCLPACPTYTRLGDEADSPRGRLHLMRAVVEGRLETDDPAFATHIDRCLGCRACETVCPSGVEYGLLLEAARAAVLDVRPPSALTRALLLGFGTDRMRGLLMGAGRLLRGSGLASLLLRLLPDTALFANARMGLAMLVASGPARGVIAGGRLPRSAGDAGTVALLDGCVQEGLFARVNGATARTLAANGYAVRTAAGQGCCGALHAHAGAVEDARALARRNIAAFETSGADWIVTNAAGCGAAMREYGHLLADDAAWAERAARLAARVRDVTELLVAQGPRPGAELRRRVTYDAPCHLHHAQKVTTAPLVVLDAIPGLERVPLRGAEECCGGAGIYALTHPDLGGRIGGDKVRAVRETGAELVATGNPGCMMQIGAGLVLDGAGTEAVHPVELLDASYRAAGYYDQGEAV